jgi:CDP-2,3-bis-(O-geranylgeranyl)-sn-glycerol synthase
VRLLGGHKTVVGFGAGVLAAFVVTLAQSRIAWAGGLVAYDHWVALGLRSAGRGIPPGTPWIPWDQVDFALGALILVSGQAALSWSDLAISLLLSARREGVDLPLPHVAAYELGDPALQHEGL